MRLCTRVSGQALLRKGWPPVSSLLRIGGFIVLIKADLHQDHGT